MKEAKGATGLKQPLPDRQTLKKYFTYWDEVVLVEVVADGTRPVSTVGNLDKRDDDIRVAHQEGLLRRQPVDLGVSTFTAQDISVRFHQAQIKAANHLNENKDGYWSLAQTIERLQLPEEDTTRTNVFSTELVDALPTPAGDVPTRRILEFRDQYSRLLRQFQVSLHNLYAEVQNHPNQELALTNAVDELELALDELHTVMEDQRLRPRRISLDTFWSVSWEAVKAFFAATGAGIPTEFALAFAGGEASLSLEMAEGPQPTSWPDEVSDYAYLFHADQELQD